MMTKPLNSMNAVISRELSGWNKGEVLWLVTSCVAVVAAAVLGGDTLLGILSAVTGIANVVCTGKGKLSAFGFGIINSVLYAIISYQSQLYGETMLNICYYLPMQFVGFAVWARHVDATTKEVVKRHMQRKARCGMLLGIAAGTMLYGTLLSHLGDALPYVDAFTTVASVIALVVSVGMYAEQWWIWLVVDAVSVYMWWMDYSAGTGNIATLLMWVVFLMNAIGMIVRWERTLIIKN